MLVQGWQRQKLLSETDVLPAREKLSSGDWWIVARPREPQPG